MYFSSFAELCYMSGHGFYVWLAYGIAVSIMIALTVYPLQKKAKMLKAIKQRVLHEGVKHGNAP